MALGHQNEPVAIADVRRRMAFRVFGAYRFLNNVQSALRDIDGAVEAGQYTVAALEARNFVLNCLSIAGLADGGEIDDSPGTVTFDHFAGVTADEIAQGMALANEGFEITEETAAGWVARIHAFAAEIERSLDYPDPLPQLRSAEGSFGFIGLAKQWVDAIQALQLPALMPPEWLSTPEA